jgi:hypothetical protein
VATNAAAARGDLRSRALTGGYTPKEDAMPKYVIEREIPDAGSWNAEQRRAVARQSCGVLSELGTGIQWVHSYVTDDRVYCVYLADDASLLQKHAQQAGFPADRVTQVHAVIEPVTAEA